MAIALLMRKDDHTPRDLRMLSEAPYFDVHLIRQTAIDPPRHRVPPTLDEVSDEELVPAGTPIRSNSIAPSTRKALERALGQDLPTVREGEQGPFMKSRQLRDLLVRRPDLQLDPTVGDLYTLLKLATKLGFSIGWYEQSR
jgi:hypothetical protein